MLATAPLWAQVTAARAPGSADDQIFLAGLVRGVLTDASLNAKSGEFSVRTASGDNFRYTYNRLTWFERSSERIQPASLRVGELLEIVADRELSPTRYARVVHVLEATATRRPRTASGLYRMSHRPPEFLPPRGDLIYSGIIARITPERMILRTRVDGEKIIYLRSDTSYLDGGFQVDHDYLKLNTRIFVRAGRNLDNEIEAYQIIWGEILEPETQH